MKYIRKIHLWLSVPFGIIITLTCFSGAMLVFEPEITRALQNEIYYVASSEGEPRPIEELMETVKATLPDSVSITGVTVFADKELTYQVGLSKPRRAAIFIDQYSGEITGKYERLGFFSTMFKLHRWLLDSANPHGEGIKAGKLLVGISTIMFVIALITGAVMWWQRARKSVRAHAPSPAEQQPANPALPQHGPRGGFWRSLAISWRNGWPAFWKSLHVAGGMYVIIFLLAMALTGLTWSFQWCHAPAYGLLHLDKASLEKAKRSEDRPLSTCWQQRRHPARGWGVAAFCFYACAPRKASLNLFLGETGQLGLRPAGLSLATIIAQLVI